MTFGDRLRSARKDAGLSGPELAKKLGVSAQTVSEWERGRYFPEADRLRSISQYVHMSVDFLLTGKVGVSLTAEISAGGGRLVPRVPFDELQALNTNDPSTYKQSWDRVYSHYPCSSTSFQHTIADAANAPLFSPGDSIIVDPDVNPEPGDMVMVITQSQPMFRRFRPRGGLAELVPLNTDWEAMTVQIGQDARFLGTMTEHARRRR